MTKLWRRARLAPRCPLLGLGAAGKFCRFLDEEGLAFWRIDPASKFVAQTGSQAHVLSVGEWLDLAV
ncbi:MULTISPECIES: hypothetical protein [unclassified Mycobacterium]|uniref:hypothetical protein n=1 Tax=unclassified Mycobacterium TaxID=2642494 RepID=UPI0012E78B6F|nr:MULTISPECIES: hypothetical protein [unclassified Mycobacterium]